jgi:hypothetical protein
MRGSEGMSIQCAWSCCNREVYKVIITWYRSNVLADSASSHLLLARISKNIYHPIAPSYNGRTHVCNICLYHCTQSVRIGKVLWSLMLTEAKMPKAEQNISDSFSGPSIYRSAPPCFRGLTWVVGESRNQSLCFTRGANMVLPARRGNVIQENRTTRRKLRLKVRTQSWLMFGGPMPRHRLSLSCSKSQLLLPINIQQLSKMQWVTIYLPWIQDGS